MLFGGKKKKAAVRIDLDFFEEMFRRVWARAVSVLGVTNTRSIFEHALVEAARHYPLLFEVRVCDFGVRLGSLKKVLPRGEKPENLEEALWAFLKIFHCLLSELSGETMSQEIVAAFEKHSHRKESGQISAFLR